MARICLVLLLALLPSGCRNEKSPIKAIIGATLKNNAGGTSLTDSVIVIDGSRIRSAGPRANVPIPQDSERLNASGETVVPAGETDAIAPGKPANLILLTSDGKIDRAMEEGRWVPATPPPRR